MMPDFDKNKVSTVMVNNSTNINNYISHQIIEHRKVPDHMTLEIQLLTWYMHTYVVSVHVLFISSIKTISNCSIQNKKTHTKALIGYSDILC